jgi:hypothetical protein
MFVWGGWRNVSVLGSADFGLKNAALHLYLRMPDTTGLADNKTTPKNVPGQDELPLALFYQIDSLKRKKKKNGK